MRRGIQAAVLSAPRVAPFPHATFRVVSERARQLSQEVLRLSESDRLALLGELIESLDEAAEGDVEAAWLDEVQRRDALAGDDPEAGEEWTEVRARIAGELTKR